MNYVEESRALTVRKKALSGKTSYEPALHCRYVSRHGEPCFNIAAVINYPRWPVCDQHRHTRSGTSMRNFARYVWRRGIERGLIDQAQTLAHAESEFERMLRQYEAPYDPDGLGFP
jgi:hypothetical protein